MKISIGSDHAGFAYKDALAAMLRAEGHDVTDVGTFSEESVDYPDYGIAAAKLVANGTASAGVLVCGSGIGISIAANKVHGIRAANCTSVEMAALARQHNDANMVAVGQRLVTLETAMDIVRTFLATAFEGGRHQRRVDKIEATEGTLP
ncbi:MAG: ribose 5-phosphate isomerase B [Candidatus Kapabacteria bacterium]|jgi:ribose 5-phosphate isomerase B|nr:ribose 5-phosphate isomerase B [Candidatus Kapabacteria bacterium]